MNGDRSASYGYDARIELANGVLAAASAPFSFGLRISDCHLGPHLRLI
jgi:hypothetical protein